MPVETKVYYYFKFIFHNNVFKLTRSLTIYAPSFFQVPGIIKIMKLQEI